MKVGVGVGAKINSSCFNSFLFSVVLECIKIKMSFVNVIIFLMNTSQMKWVDSASILIERLKAHLMLLCQFCILCEFQTLLLNKFHA